MTERMASMQQGDGVAGVAGRKDPLGDGLAGSLGGPVVVDVEEVVDQAQRELYDEHRGGRDQHLTQGTAEQRHQCSHDDGERHRLARMNGPQQGSELPRSPQGGRCAHGRSIEHHIPRGRCFRQVSSAYPDLRNIRNRILSSPETASDLRKHRKGRSGPVLD